MYILSFFILKKERERKRMSNMIEYLNSLPENLKTINISGCNLTKLPDLSRFYNLKYLFCNKNKLTTLPELPTSLIYLCCSENQLTSLPPLNSNLINLYCDSNQLTSLPSLPEKLKILHCDSNQLISLPSLNIDLECISCLNNQLTTLPSLPEKLITLNCHSNKLTFLPSLPNSLKYLCCLNNPIFRIINDQDIKIISQKIKIINKIRVIYYHLKFKKQFRKILWEKIREPKIQQYYSPDNLIHLLKEKEEKEDIDEILGSW
jgi:Leucine-rich repeat (LRR) protein